MIIYCLSIVVKTKIMNPFFTISLNIVLELKKPHLVKANYTLKRARFDDELSVGENCTLRPIPSFLQGAYFFETRADENEQKTLSVRVQGPASIYLVLKGDEDDRSESSSGEDKDSSSDTEEGDDRDRIERSASKDGETSSETREDDETDRSETSKSGEERSSNFSFKVPVRTRGIFCIPLSDLSKCFEGGRVKRRLRETDNFSSFSTGRKSIFAAP